MPHERELAIRSPKAAYLAHTIDQVSGTKDPMLRSDSAVTYMATRFRVVPTGSFRQGHAASVALPFLKDSWPLRCRFRNYMPSATPLLAQYSTSAE